MTQRILLAACGVLVAATSLPAQQAAGGDASAAVRKSFGPWTASGDVGELIDNVGHTNLHYGNIVTYMRMLGLVPPREPGPSLSSVG
jgi:hypothetical protein